MSQSLPLVNPATSSCCLAKIFPESCLNKSTVIKASLVVLALLFIASSIFVGCGGHSYLPAVLPVGSNQIIASTTLGIIGLGFGLAVLEWNIIDLFQAKDAQPVKYPRSPTPLSSPVKSPAPVPLSPVRAPEAAAIDDGLPENHPTNWQVKFSAGYDSANSEGFEFEYGDDTALIVATGKDLSSIDPNYYDTAITMMHIPATQCDNAVALKWLGYVLTLHHCPSAETKTEDGVMTVTFKIHHIRLADFIVIPDDIHTIKIVENDGKDIATLSIPDA